MRYCYGFCGWLTGIQLLRFVAASDKRMTKKTGENELC